MDKIKYLLAVIILGSSQLVYAFDENRGGFLLGVGAGLHSTDIDYFFNGNPDGSESESGFATSFKLGGGITDQFALYYVRNASWYSAPAYNGFTVSDTTYTVGISGLGATFYFSPTAPSGYVMAAAGVGDNTAVFESGVDTDTGSAFMLGGGYEFSPHLQLEVTLLRTDLDVSGFSLETLETSSVQVTMNYVWY